MARHPTRASHRALVLGVALAAMIACLSGWSVDVAWAQEESKLKKLALLKSPKFEFELTDCDRRLLDAAPNGDFAYCGPTGSSMDPVPAENNAKRDKDALHSELIRWLCVDREAVKLPDPKGLRIHAARILGKLDLSFVTVPFPLIFENCRFTEPIDFSGSQVEELNLAGSQSHGIEGEGLTVRGNLSLGDGFSSKGVVNLLGATIGGVSDFRGGSFANPGGPALIADRLKVGGSVFLSNGFRSEGEVHLLGANIGANLECDAGTFKNESGMSLNASAARVAGTVFLRNGFSSQGEVRLLGANIGGNLEGTRGTFLNPGQTALNADGTKVVGTAFLNGGFSSKGEVNLAVADIGRNLDCSGGKFLNRGQDALRADGIKVAGNVFLSDGFNSEGAVRLSGANIGGNLEGIGGTLLSPGQTVLIADRLKVGGSIFLRDRFRAEGLIALAVADVTGDLDLDGARFSGVSGLQADAVTVKGRFYWRNIQRERGAKLLLELAHATFGPIFDDEKSWPEQGDLSLDGFIYTRIGGGPKDARTRLRWLDLQRPPTPSVTQYLTQWWRRLALGKREGAAGTTPGRVHTPAVHEHLAKAQGPRIPTVTQRLAESPWEFTPQPYEQLAKVLQEAGDGAGRRRALIAMENARWRYGKSGFWERCWNWVLWLTIGYGYQPLRAFGAIALFVITGTLLFSWGHRAGVIVQTERDSPRPYRPFNGFVYSLETFLPLVELYQGKHWLPDVKLHPRARYLRWYLWLHILAGWFFTSMLIAGITGLVQRG